MASNAPDVRLATDSDLDEILSWLQLEDAQRLEGCFWCNRMEIQSSQKAGKLTVLSESAGGQPIGFCVRSGCEVTILAIRYELRGKGHGGRFARHIIEVADEEGLPGLHCQCSPETSIGFWKGLGFERVYPDERLYYVARPFLRKCELASDTPVITIRIQLFQDKSLVQNFETRASDKEGTFILETEFVACKPKFDARILVEVNGIQVHDDEVKYSEDNGVEYDPSWVIISEFTPTCGLVAGG